MSEIKLIHIIINDDDTRVVLGTAVHWTWDLPDWESRESIKSHTLSIQLLLLELVAQQKVLYIAPDFITVEDSKILR
jgi:hypothetical protein